MAEHRAVSKRDIAWARLAVVWFAAGLLAVHGGCVRRRMTILSNPPGAQVFVDDYEIGTTPISTDFIYYGTRRIRLVKDGYETLTIMQPVPTPWYQIPPLDFVSENLIPGEIRDHRTLSYQLTPQKAVPTDELLRRAEGLRRDTQGVAAASPPAAAPPAFQPIPPGPTFTPAPRGPEPIPAPPGVGGQPVYPLPPSGR